MTDRIDRLRRPDRPRRRQRPARPDVLRQRPPRARAARARARALRLRAPAPRYVDVRYSDPHVRKAFIELRAGGRARPTAAVARRARRGIARGRALIIDRRRARARAPRRPRPGPRRQGARRSRRSQHAAAVQNERAVNWTIAAYPTAGQAEQVFGEPDVERLWDASRTAVRLDEPDPVAAWREHAAKLQRTLRAARRARPRRDPLRGPGHRPHRRAAARAPLDRRRHRDARRHRATSRTCRPRRSSRARTGGAPRARCARRGRSRSAARSSATSSCASQAARRST